MDLVVNPNHMYPIGIMYRCGSPCNKTKIWTNSIRGGQRGYQDLIVYLQGATDRFTQGICNDKYCGKCFGYIQCLKNGYSWPGAHRNADLFGCRTCDNKFAAWTDLYEEENPDVEDERNYYTFYKFYSRMLNAPGDPLRKLMSQDQEEHRRNPYRRNADDSLRQLERIANRTRSPDDIAKYDRAASRAGIRVLRDTLGDFYEKDRQKYGLFLGRPIQFIYQGQDVWGRVADAYTGLSFPVLIPGDHNEHMVTDVYGWSQNPPWARDLPKMIRTNQGLVYPTSHWIDDPRLQRKINPSELSDMQESSCDCPACRDMCRRTPCWPTPQEADHLLDLGYLDRLDLDYFQGFDTKAQRFVPAVWAVVPKLLGTEMFPKGCIFQKEGLCELHGKHKPLEGRLAHHAGTSKNLRSQMASLWDTPEGRRVVERFNRMKSRRNPEERDPDLVNEEWRKITGEDWVRPADWKYPEDWGSPAWKRRMAETYKKAGVLLLQYGFEVCPKCGVQHSGLTMCCRNCNHSNRPKE
jgi:hypothetical protein